MYIYRGVHGPVNGTVDLHDRPGRTFWYFKFWDRTGPDRIDLAGLGRSTWSALGLIFLPKTMAGKILGLQIQFFNPKITDLIKTHFHNKPNIKPKHSEERKMRQRKKGTSEEENGVVEVVAKMVNGVVELNCKDGGERYDGG